MTATSARTAALGSLKPGQHFTLDGREYRVIWHWSTGVEAAEVASWGALDAPILPPATVVEVV